MMRKDASILLSLLLSANCSLASFADSASPSMLQNKYSPSPVADQWANRGVDLANQGDFPAAIEALYEAWKLSPEKTNSYAQNLSSAYNNYAKQLAERGKLDEAITQLRKAIFFQEENRTIDGNLDILLQRKGVNPTDFKVRLTEAERLRGNGYVDEAIAEYLKAISLAKPGSAEQQKAKLELAQVYQVVYSKYAANPVGQARLERMIALVQELIRANPKDSKPYLLLGKAYATAEKLPEAINAFETALKLNPQDKAALEGLVGCWRQVVEIAPNEPENLLGLGNALVRAGQADEAEQVLKKAKAINPQNPEVDKLLASTKELGKEAELYRIAERAFEAQKLGKFDEAIDLYQIAIKGLPPTPETANVYYNLGLAYQSKSQTAQALQAYNQALKFNPANEAAQKAIKQIQQQAVAARTRTVERAVALQGQGNLKEAIQLYQQVLMEDPNNAQVHFNLGTAYQEANKPREALEQYKYASKLAPTNNDFSAAVAAIQKAIDSGAFEAAQASDILKEAVNLQQAGKMTQAIARYRDALKLDPRNAQAHFNLATALHSSTKLTEAAEEYKESYRIDPANYPEANYFIGNLLETQKKYSDATAYYKRYLEDQPKAEYSQAAEERIRLLNSNN
jgi:tetratricopeptide (TPR) repeat protein